MSRSLFRLLLITSMMTNQFCTSKPPKEPDVKMDYKSVEGHDTNFFDIEQKYINGKSIDFDRFFGLNTIVVFVGKKGQDCDDIDKVLHGLYQLHNFFRYGVEYVIVTDSSKLVKACSNVFQELLSDNGVNYVLTEPVHKTDDDDRPHAVFEYMKKLFHPTKIEIGMDKIHFLVRPAGHIELYYDVSISQLKSFLHNNLRYLEKSEF